jgi:hypothetical protein
LKALMNSTNDTRDPGDGGVAPVVTAATLAPFLDHLLEAQAENDQIVALLREMLKGVQREREHVRAATGGLDATHRLLYVGGVRTGLSIRDAAVRLRAPLRTLKHADVHRRPSIRILYKACIEVDEVARALSDDALRGSTLRNKLGAGPQDFLLDLVAGTAA